MNGKYHGLLSALTGGCMGVLSFFVTDFLDVRDLDNKIALIYFLPGTIVGLIGLWYLKKKKFYYSDMFRSWMVVFFIFNLFFAFFAAYYGGILGSYIIFLVFAYPNLIGSADSMPTVSILALYLITIVLFVYFLRWFVKGCIIFLEKKTSI